MRDAIVMHHTGSRGLVVVCHQFALTAYTIALASLARMICARNCAPSSRSTSVSKRAPGHND